MTKTEMLESALEQAANESGRDPYRIYLDEDFPEPRYTVNVGGIGTLPLGDIAAIKAKSKNGKSYLASIFAAAIHGADIFGMVSNFKRSTVLYFDTEQNRRNTARLSRRISALAGYPTNEVLDTLVCFSLREMNTLDRWPYICAQCEKFQPTVIIVDGIADLIQDFNDVKESEEIINKLMQLSSERDICIITILHTNKAKDDNNMKGHLGTMLVQKASDVFEVKKNGSTFTVTETECRNQNVEEFSFILDNDAMPVPTNAPVSVKQMMKNNEITKTLAEVFKNEKLIRYNELVKRYETYGACSNGTAKNRIKEAVANGYIKPQDSGGYTLALDGAGG